ncbi:MAG: YfiR family protein [Candidatus Eisenbacteria bacterium]
MRASTRTTLVTSGVTTDRRPIPSRSVRLVLAMSLALGLCPGIVLGASLEATKADMVWNLAKFVQWPERSMPKGRGQLIVTILGEDEFAATLANQLSNRTVNGKPVFVRFAQRVQDVRGSHMVYIAAPEMAHADAILEALKGTPVLTLADAPGFASRGGMVNFSSNDGRVRFEIHMGHTEESGLHISSRLLALARVIDSR